MLIYLIKNTVTNDFYIGKTSKTVSKRLAEHTKLSKSKSQTYFHRAIRKYGIENFIVEILEKDILDNCMLNDREIFWIQQLSPKYNMTIGGDGVVGYTPTEEHKKNMSLSKSGIKNSKEHNQNISLAKKGKKQSKEHIMKRTLQKLGTFHKEETLQKMSIAKLRKPKVKNVCRISDKKEMNIANFVYLLNKQTV
jgi:group I intron endonuclease